MSITINTGKRAIVIDELEKIAAKSSQKIWYCTPNADSYPYSQHAIYQGTLPDGWENGYPNGAVVVFGYPSAQDTLETELKRIVESQSRFKGEQNSEREVIVYIVVETPENIADKIYRIAKSIEQQVSSRIRYIEIVQEASDFLA